MMKLIKATVISGQGPDHVYLETNLPEPTWPYEGKLNLHFNVAACQAMEYLRQHFTFDDEDITYISH